MGRHKAMSISEYARAPLPQAQPSATLSGFAHLLCQCDQFFDDSHGFDGAVLIFAVGFLKPQVSRQSTWTE
jgi:hypothetical protein